MTRVPASHLLAQFLREEWRLHSRLFGGARFAAFPPFVALLVAGAFEFFTRAGADALAVLVGVHALAFAFGLHVGTIGLVGRDAMENLLGDTTLLLSVSRTLPVSQRRLLAVFLVKDVVYYTVFFVTPLVAGVALAAAVRGETALVLGLPVAWLTAVATFALGVAVSLTLVALGTRSRAGAAALVATFAFAGWRVPDLLVAATPYAAFVDPTLANALVPLGVTAAFAIAGFGAFSFDRRRPARTSSTRLRSISAHVPGDRDGLVAKSLLDVHRSSGGALKLVFSLGLVFAVGAVVIEALIRIFPFDPVPGVAFGALLALGAFTTYNWLTQADDVTVYLALPLPLASVFRAKLVAFLLTAVPVGLMYLVLAGLLFGAGGLPVGVVVFVSLSVYLFGVTSYLTGLSPNELLFDAAVFAKFWALLSAPLVPVLVYALVPSALPSTTPVAVLFLVGLCAVVGYAAAGRAGPRWEARTMAGGT